MFDLSLSPLPELETSIAPCPTVRACWPSRP